MPVEIDGSAVVGATQLDAGYILYLRDAPVGAYLDDNISELGRISQPALRIHRVLESRALFGERRPAHDSRSHLDVLLSDCGDHIARDHVSRRHLVGIEPPPD